MRKQRGEPTQKVPTDDDLYGSKEWIIVDSQIEMRPEKV
jgi:hypothetical protein